MAMNYLHWQVLACIFNCVRGGAYVSMYNARVGPYQSNCLHQPTSWWMMAATPALRCKSKSVVGDQCWYCSACVTCACEAFVAYKLQQQGRRSLQIPVVVYLEFMSFAFPLYKAIFWWTIFLLAVSCMHSTSTKARTQPRPQNGTFMVCSHLRLRTSIT